MGCIGKITSYIETPDYRLVLNLEVFVDLFYMKEPYSKGYYQATVDCQIIYQI